MSHTVCRFFNCLPACPAGHARCRESLNECVSVDQFCDGQCDCSDGSDEASMYDEGDENTWTANYIMQTLYVIKVGKEGLGISMNHNQSFPKFCVHVISHLISLLFCNDVCGRMWNICYCH